ncbi:MAG TPA: MFS transporter [Steroidobacteraceae bacterium]|nr:MFS transporter [Steroidobacteraceae bacterium]
MPERPAVTASPPLQPVGRRLARSGLAALTLVNLLNYLDRYLVSALVPDLERAHMGLTRFRLGMLMTGFLVVYMCFAWLFGVLGDRRSRPRVIAVGVLLWSLATTLSGFARSYVHLLIGRAVVGIGEAAYGTISPALLADYFPRSARGRVFAVFFMAIPVGSALGYIVGGLMDHWYGWRAAFFVAGLPGLALTLWVLHLPDPPRGIQEESPERQPEALSRTAVTVYWSLLKRLPYMLTVLGYAAYTFAVGGLAFWMPDFLESVRGIPAAQATTGFGAIVVVTGFIGTFVGGWLGDYWLKSSREAYLWLSALTALGAVPLSILALAAGTPVMYYSGIIAAELLLFMSTGPINSAIVNLVAPAERASAVALSIFLIHTLGDVISPPLIGALSDRSSLGSAVLIVPVAIVACGGLWLAAGGAARAAGASYAAAA